MTRRAIALDTVWRIGLALEPHDPYRRNKTV